MKDLRRKAEGCRGHEFKRCRFMLEGLSLYGRASMDLGPRIIVARQPRLSADFKTTYGRSPVFGEVFYIGIRRCSINSRCWSPSSVSAGKNLTFYINLGVSLEYGELCLCCKQAGLYVNSLFWRSRKYRCASWIGCHLY